MLFFTFIKSRNMNLNCYLIGNFIILEFKLSLKFVFYVKNCY